MGVVHQTHVLVAVEMNRENGVEFVPGLDDPEAVPVEEAEHPQLPVHAACHHAQVGQGQRLDLPAPHVQHAINHCLASLSDCIVYGDILIAVQWKKDEHIRIFFLYYS